MPTYSGELDTRYEYILHDHWRLRMVQLILVDEDTIKFHLEGHENTYGRYVLNDGVVKKNTAGKYSGFNEYTCPDHGDGKTRYGVTIEIDVRPGDSDSVCHIEGKWIDHEKDPDCEGSIELFFGDLEIQHR